ncbi:MoaD/ThiS family protein [Candidatus Cryosericum terrychapinii]|nr:MoaD/ThiS family protein [Candidatus Cryosericum terrychapinii]
MAMATVTVRVYLTEEFKQGPVLVSASTCIEALRSLVAQHPVLKGIILTEELRLKRDYIYLLNGKSIEFLGKEDALLKDGDTISLFPPIGGG